MRPSLPAVGHPVDQGPMWWWPLEWFMAVSMQVLVANVNLGSVLASSPDTLSPELSSPRARRLLLWIS